MFEKELRGEDYNKAQHRRQLLPLLDGRSEGAIEYKHQNISAVLIELGHPYIDGYKPQRNYQQLLFDVVEDRLAAADGLQHLIAAEVEREADVPTVGDILNRLVAPPPPESGRPAEYGRERPVPRHSTPNYLEREARNASLGAAGERFVMEFERARLLAARADRLAAEVEHVSTTRGDHEGFDILSFEADGRERLIEVKTTSFGAMTPFFVSSNQLQTSRREEPRYHVYRLFRFRSDPQFFALQGAINQTCEIRPTEYLARLA